MYRKLHIFALIALVIVSCSKEEMVKDVAVQFNAAIIPEMTVLSKSGTQPEEVVANCALLQAWKGEVLVANVVQPITPGTVQINFSGVRLVEGEQYDIYIWVGCDGYYNTEDLRIVTLKDDKPYDGKSAGFDAFFAYTTVSCSREEAIHSVTLKRPFAKLTFSAQVASPLTVQFTAPTTLDLKTGVVSGERNVDYSVDPIDASVTAFDYIFADEGVTEMDYTFKLGEDDSKTTSVPVKRNTKTNIIYNVTN